MQHSVKALVKEPAVSDGRIQPGDKLIAANGVQLANFSHAELIAFLRNCLGTLFTVFTLINFLGFLGDSVFRHFGLYTCTVK